MPRRPITRGNVATLHSSTVFSQQQVSYGLKQDWLIQPWEGLVCQRYIELILVRSAMASNPADCSWSSFRANALGQANALLTPHRLYIALAADDASRQGAFGDLFRSALDEAPLADLRMALNQGQPIGNRRFCAQIAAMTGQRRKIRKRGRLRKKANKEPLGDDGAARTVYLE